MIFLFLLRLLDNQMQYNSVYQQSVLMSNVVVEKRVTVVVFEYSILVYSSITGISFLLSSIGVVIAVNNTFNVYSNITVSSMYYLGIINEQFRF